MLTLLDLFSGIGGFSLGMEATKRIKTIGFVEKDKFCQKVLRKNFKDVPIEEDIRNVRGERYSADIVSGGFPCQPFSVAGKRKGTEDDRYLWDEMLRVITEVKPKFVVGENVQGIININNGLVLRQVQTDLEAQGFQVQCFLIPASGIGAWHRRNRVWILAHSNDNGSSANQDRGSIKKTIYETQERENITLNSERSSSTSSTKNNVANSKSKWSRECRNINKKERLEESKSTQSDCICSDVPNTYGKLSNGCSSTTRNSKTKFKRVECNQSWNWNEVRSKTERCSEQDREDVQHTNNKRFKESNLSKEPNKQNINSGKHDSTTENKTWWQTQSELCGVPNGISYELDKGRTNRIKSLGNAIVPQIAFEIGKAILAAEDDKID